MPNPFGFSAADLPGLFMSLIMAGENKRQADEQNAQSKQQHANVLGGWSAMGTGGQPGLMDAAGNYHLMPWNTMGELDEYKADLGRQIGLDNAVQEARFQDYASGALGRQQELGTTLTNAYSGMADRLAGAFDRGAAGLEQGFDARYRRGLANLQGMGDQERRDINERYDARSGALNQDLISRGIRNSTVAQSMQQGNERERTADLGRLEERVRQQRLATDAALSGDLLNMQGQNFTNRMNLMGGLEQGGFDLQSQLGHNLMNTQNSLSAGLIDMQNANRRAITDFNLGVEQQRQNYGNTANVNMLNAIAGTNFMPPTNDYLQLAHGLGAAQQATNVLDWQQEQARKANERAWFQPLAQTAMNAVGGLGMAPLAGMQAGLTTGFSNTMLGKAWGG